MSEITDWEPLASPTIEYSVNEYRQKLRDLQIQLKLTESLHAKALQQAKKTHQDAFTCFKADVIVTFKALELVAIASQRHGEIDLNHHVRDMRLEHLQGIITNAIKDFNDRTLSTYDDF
ncbi:MAG: hypothetical protein AUK48_02100 [Oscillatoriales cyanobacterium CG2_30_44_21]|nr:MAG: hypothetical protein AUK48_02100 [Oscillatoriales cyanobacterium CG2_30_44_21]